nr:hypothetical protein BaRGS_010824 [Batillaria attramentaria]
MNACRKKPAAPLHPIPVPKKKWSLVGMDIIGPLQVTDRGNQYIVALTDHFTKFPVAKAIPCKSSEEVARFMYETICIFGAFDSLITDQGREFINFALDILTDRFNINHRISSAYHPETNGQRERDNRTLKDTLVKITDNDDWDELLPAALFAYRTSVHKSTQFSPFLALYGEQAKLPFDVTGDANEQDLNEEIMDTMKGIHEEVKNKIGENISRAQKKQKEYYDSRRAYDHGFRIGDKVLIINAARVHRMGGKMAPRFVGPYEFGSWAYNGLQLDVTNRSQAGDISSFIANSEFHLDSIPLERHELYYACCPEPYPDVTFYVIVKRKPTFYVINLLFPCILITSVAALGFILPPDAGEKIGLEITVLLALAVFQLLLSEAMPPSSETFPMIGVYFACSMMLVMLSTIITVLVLNVHHTEHKRLPKLVRVIFLDKLARVVCYKKHASVHPQEEEVPFNRSLSNGLAHSYDGKGHKEKGIDRPHLPPIRSDNSKAHNESSPLVIPSEETSSNLRYLDATGSGLHFDFLERNMALVHLSLSSCNISSIPGMAFPNLQSLDLSYNRIRSLSGRRLRLFRNVRALFLEAAGQASIYFSVRANSMTVGDRSGSSQEKTIARRLISIAMSDFLCWFPIGLLGLMASQGSAFPVSLVSDEAKDFKQTAGIFILR